METVCEAIPAVCEAIPAEIRLMRGHRAVRSDTFDRVWSPMQLLDGSPTWQDEPHVVVLGDEVFSVTRTTKVQTPSGHRSDGCP